MRPLDADGLAAREALAAPLADDAKEELEGQGVARAGIRVSVLAHLRYLGTDSALRGSTRHSCRAQKRVRGDAPQRFGFTSPDKPIEIEAIEVEALGGGDHPHEPDMPLSIDELRPNRQAKTRLFTGGAWHDAPVFLRAGLEPSHCILGPALIIEPHQTVVVEPHWQARSRRRTICCSRASRNARRGHALGTNVDPVLLEVFNKRFTAIAEQMGYALQNTARSVNIKERLDFSCAIFDGDGRLVANAPHMPVHLGSMDRSVETVRREVGAISSPAMSWMLNAPYNGGTHLPDITVVTPVFAESGAEILFFVAARGHHADIGGIAPGSMRPDATRIEEEGVYIDPFKLVETARFREEACPSFSRKAPTLPATRRRTSPT